jgi:Ethanolamine utilization protein EutJ (predicted chaperonin)
LVVTAPDANVVKYNCPTMLPAMAYRLGVDFGTSHTVAFLAWPDGQVQPLLFDGSPMLTSAVCATPDGGLLVGRDATASAPVWPELFEPAPKRRVIERLVLLGEREFAVTELIAAVLRRVEAEAAAVAGQRPSEVVCTYPASWGTARREVVVEASRLAGLGKIRLVDEPSAAAALFATRARVPMGACLVVYDLGAGTFDASVVRRTVSGFEVVATEGLADAGGLDIDAAIVNYLGSVCASRDPEAWERLCAPRTSADTRSRLRLWTDVRAAKEMLSRASQAYVNIPLLETDVALGRDELERLARPVLDRTVAITELLIRGAGLDPAAVGIFLVGGGSRMPLVANVLHRATGVPPTVVEQPDLIVAQGCLLLGAAGTGQSIPTAGVPTSPGIPNMAGPTMAGPATAGPATAGPATVRVDPPARVAAFTGVDTPPVRAPEMPVSRPRPSWIPADQAAMAQSGIGYPRTSRLDASQPGPTPRGSAARRRPALLAIVAAVVVLAGAITALSLKLAGNTGMLAGQTRHPSSLASTAKVAEIAGPGSTGLTTNPTASSRPSGSSTASPRKSSSPTPTATRTTASASATPTPQCTSSGTLRYTAPNVPSSVCIKKPVTLDISPVDVALTSSDYDVVQCSFYQAQSLGRCIMYGTGQATVQSTGTHKWTMAVSVVS